MLSTLPSPTITTRTDISGGGSNVNQSSPSISYDPNSHQKLVSVYTTNNPSAGGDQKVFIGGSYSVDGGANWKTFTIPGNVSDPAIQSGQLFARATDASVAFDLNHNFYLVYSEHTSDNSRGALVMQKYSFTSGAPNVTVNSVKLYQWSGDDSAWSPSLAVDNNLPLFTDPTTSVTQTDGHSGDIYVTWATQDTAPVSNPVPSPFNANTVRLIGSHDGGVTFTAPMIWNSNAHVGGTGSEHAVAPKIVISQGTVRTSGGKPVVPGGQVTVIWDDINGQRNASPPLDQIWAAHSSSGTAAYTFFDSNQHIINDGQPQLFLPRTNINVHTPINAANKPIAIVTGSLDNDSFPDAVVLSSGSKDVSVLRGNGNGTFVPATHFTAVTTGTKTIAMASGDFDNDNKLDLLVVDDVGVNFLKGNGDDTFNAPVQVLAQTNLTAITVGTFGNLDSNLDFAVTSSSTGKVTVGLNALNAGILTFNASIYQVNGAGNIAILNQSAITHGKMNTGDIEDLVVANATDNSFSVLIGNADGTFTSSSSARFATGTNPHALAITDPNADKVDVVVLTNAGATTYLNTTAGPTFGLTQLSTMASIAGENQASILLLDVTGDGQLDEVISNNGTNEVLVGVGDGSGNFTRAVDPTFPVGVQPLGLAAADFDNNGKQDVMVANNGDDTVSLLKRPTNPAVLPHTTTYPLNVSISDPNFALTNLQVNLRLTHPDDQQLQVVLRAPAALANAGVGPFTLILNRVTGTGQPVNQNNPTSRGISGQNIGYLPGGALDVIFDDQAARNINDSSATSDVGTFKPELGNFSSLLGKLDTDVSGTWTLEITDFVPNSPPVPIQHLDEWGLRFSSGTTHTAAESKVATTTVLGALDNGSLPLSPGVSPDVGVGPAAVIASDNTLGSFSPYQGRLYVAYVNRSTATGNPADNTDIYLVTSDNGGTSWSTPHAKINDDNTITDGFSEANGGLAGRPQFMPSVAVDQTTGTLVMTWLDARNDPARDQVATYITSSIDGGATYSPQTFVNTPNVMTDAITRQTVTRGPLPDNQSTQNSNRDQTFAFGSHQGVAAVAGHVYPVWASNLNGGTHASTLLHIYTARTAIAAGPRIVSSTMGPVSLSGASLNPAATDGSPKFTQFQVVFDRPIDPNSFTAPAVKVFFRSPTTVGTAAGTPVAVTSVAPVDLGLFGPGAANGATTFLVTLTTPQTAVGTYSYFITPTMQDRVRSVDKVTAGTTTNFAASGNQINLPLPPGAPTDTGGASGAGVVGDPLDITTSTITVANVPLTDVISSLTVKLSLTHTFDRDLVITLIDPNGTRILLSNRAGGSSHDYTNTIFDDLAATAIANGLAPFTGSFRPEQALSQLAGLSPNGTWTLEIDDVEAADTGTLVNWSIAVTTGVSGPGLGNKLDQNNNAFTGESPNGSNGAGDYYAIPNPTGTAPWNGTFFLPPFSTDTQPIIVPGPHVISTHVNGNPVTSDNLVLNQTASNIDVVFDRPMDPTTITPASVVRMIGPIGQINGPFTITGNPLGTDADAAHPQTYRIGFPTQTLSGSYAVTLASSIKSKNGDALDTNLNAGLDALRDISTTTVPVLTAAADVPQTVGAKLAESSINISDAFVIQAASLTLNITYPNDPDLTATLIAPDGTTITLFSGVGAAAVNKANFQDTVFDDTATTPIQNGAAPFFGKFNPQLPLGALNGKLSTGKWTLRISSSSAVSTGKLNSWKLTLSKPVPGTGLGELAADQATASFRIFVMDPANAQSHNTWTAVGGASISANANSGRIGGLAVDPSDPSGNTVYAAGASGGVWKTRNFLTTNPLGPTWIPLTDFGPSFGLNIGSVAVFGRNNDPNQSIVFVSTGEGDTDSRGVGFLRSMDGGATWTLLDSTTNVDANGNLTPVNSNLRDHVFVGTSGFKVLVDPKPTPGGDVIVYAGLTGGNGGVWRSLDSGKHWTKMRAGDCTDIVLDLNSGFFDALNNPTGNLQFLYAAFRNDGVYFSPNRGTVWNQLLGTVGDPLLRDTTNPTPTAVGVDNPNGTPNGAKGRISLAKPALTGNAINDVQYQGWLYALVAKTGGSLDGIYLTKDFGQNWTKVRAPIQSDLPTNDISNSDVALFGVPSFNVQGNYDQSIAVDPNNPAVIYVGGTSDGGPTGLIRVDTTFLHDAHSFYEDDASGSGALHRNLNNPVVLKSFPGSGAVNTSPIPNAMVVPYLNLIRDPNNPFLSSSSVNVIYADKFTNDGGGATWIPFDIEGTDQHRIITMVDPLTGKSRIIIGDDQGIFTAVDNNGTMMTSFAGQIVADGTRNGNIQITQFYYGAAQPSNLSAQIASAMFYGQAQDDGSPWSDPHVLDNGNITWEGPEGDGTGVATDQTGSGDVYRYNWPCCGGNTTDFFQVTPHGSYPGIGIGRTFGLLQDSKPGNTPDSQWPFLGGSSFAVNPLSGDQIIISASGKDKDGKFGRIFATGNQGRIWVEIGNPDALDNTYAPALAYGAPDPKGPGGSDPTNFFLYAGTSGGHIFVTFNGGGANGNDWIDVSTGLDGSPVQTIITNPLRGSHEAYAVTAGGVFYMANSNLFAETGVNPTWVNITANLKALTHNSFGDPTLSETQAKTLTALAADWRYAIPDDLNNPTSPTHPILYVSGESGVYRSFDKGKTWKLFPNENEDLAPADGGYLPSVHVSDLDLSVGNINPTTGRPTVKGSPDVLLATSYGRSSFAIRIAPTVVPGTLKLVGTVGGQQPLVFSGLSEVTAFGNTVRVGIFDLTSGTAVYKAGWNGTDSGAGTDISGNWTKEDGTFSITVAQGVFNPGTRIIGVRLTDDAGVVSTALLTFPPAAPSTPDLDPASDTGKFNNDNLTKDNTPTFFGTSDPGVKITILSDGLSVGTGIADQNGNWSVTTGALTATTHQITATATDIASNVVSAPSGALAVTIDIVPPAQPSTPDMIDASDSGNSNTDNYTNVTQPTFTGTAEKGATVALFDGNTQVGTTVADINDGTWTITSASLSNGAHVITAKATDVAGNTSVSSGALGVTIDVVLPNIPGTPDLTAASDDGASSTDNITSVNTPTFTGTADPNITVELLADGNVVGTGTANGAGNWSITSSALGAGTYSITARAKDLAGNVSLPSVGLTVQITTPLATPSTPDLTAASDSGSSSTDNITNVNTPTFTGTGAPANTTVELLTGGNTVVGSTTSNGSGNWTITVGAPLADATYSFTARAKSGNSTSPQSAGLSVTIDTAAPSIPGTPDLTAASDDGASSTDNSTSVKTPTFTGTGPASTIIELLSDGSVVGSMTSDLLGNWTITSSALSVNGHSMTSRSRDQAGNLSNQSGPLAITIVAAGIGTPSTPDLASFADSGTFNNDNITNFKTPTFTGTGPASATIEILADGNVVGSGASDINGNWSVTATTQLTPDKNYSITARAKNGQVTGSQSGALQITVDTTPPAVPSAPQLIALNVNKPQFKGTGPANTTIDLIVNNTSFGTTTSDLSGNWQVQTSAIPNGTFDFGARSRDVAGNVSNTSPTLKLTINNSPPPPPPLTISSYTLVNADTGKDLFDITDQVTIDLSTLPAHLAIRANPSPTNVASIKFGWDPTAGQFNANYHTESLLPYALFADANNGKTYNAGSFTPGFHTLSGTPYSKQGATGTVGTTNTIHFTIKGSANPGNPNPASISSVQLVNATNGAVLKTITEGSTINLASFPASLSLKANTAPAKVGSVKFGFDSTPGTFVSNYHVESTAPYSLFGDTNGTSFTPVTFKKGAHTLVMTIYTGSGASGQIQGTLTLHFTVT